MLFKSMYFSKIQVLIPSWFLFSKYNFCLTDAVAVERRRHKLFGDNLAVKLITKKKRRPLPINARCLFLEGIPDGCSSEHVKLFIENRVSMDEEPTIQYGEKPGTAICTFSHDIPGNDVTSFKHS